MAFPQKMLRIYYSGLFIKVVLAVALLLLFAILYFSIFYFTTGYETMQHWFLSLNDCFYNREKWSTMFFTQAVKDKGNLFAGTGAVFAVLLMLYIIFRWKAIVNRHKAAADEYTDTTGWLWYVAVAALALATGTFSWCTMRPAYDEIFSAVNCAQLHPFQTIAYYMLPNNHLYFNFTNNILFSWWWGDQVQSGRVISLAAFVVTLLFAYHWLYRLIGHRLYAFIALLPVALQFTVWAMSAQGRGYSAELLCGWVTFVAIFKFLQQPHDRYLRLHALFSVVGFALVPSYLTIYMSQGIIFVLTMAYTRRFYWRYFKYQAMAGAAILLCYIPGICFSGVAAFNDNPYVRPACADWMEFLPRFALIFKYFINYCFSMLCGEDRAINFVLFFLPLGLFFSRQSARRLVAFSYTILWLTYIVVTVYLRLNPFNRNMIVHYSITMACVLYTFYVLIEEAALLIKSIQLTKYVTAVFFSVPVFAYSTFLAVTDSKNGSYFLYFNNVNEIYDNHIKELAMIPRQSTIGFSYETFYMYYHFRNHNYKVVKCANGTEDYYIKRKSESLPPGKADTYTKLADGYEDYEYYKKK